LFIIFRIIINDTSPDWGPAGTFMGKFGFIYSEN